MFLKVFSFQIVSLQNPDETKGLYKEKLDILLQLWYLQISLFQQSVSF